MKTLITLLLLLSLATLAQTRIIPFSTNPTVAGGGEPPTGDTFTTDSLAWYWNDNTLEIGLVNSWIDSIASSELQTWGGSDTSKMPNMTASGLHFDGGDFMYKAGLTTDVDSAISLELVLDLSDTTAYQVLIGVERIHRLTISIINTTSDLYGRSYDGASSGFSEFDSTPVFGLHHIICTWAGGADDPKMYVDNVLLTDKGGSNGSNISGDRIVLGGSDDTGCIDCLAGSLIRLARVYWKALTADEVAANYNSNSVQSKLP